MTYRAYKDSTWIGHLRGSAHWAGASVSTEDYVDGHKIALKKTVGTVRGSELLEKSMHRNEDPRRVPWKRFSGICAHSGMSSGWENCGDGVLGGIGSFAGSLEVTFHLLREG